MKKKKSLPPAPPQIQDPGFIENGRTRARQVIDLWQALGWIRWVAAVLVALGAMITSAVKVKGYLDFWYTPTSVTEDVKRDLGNLNRTLEREVKRMEEKIDEVKQAQRRAEWRRER